MHARWTAEARHGLDLQDDLAWNAATPLSLERLGPLGQGQLDSWVVPHFRGVSA